jgi:hypothetical protein
MGSLRTLLKKDKPPKWYYSDRIYIPHVEYPPSPTIATHLDASIRGKWFLELLGKLGFVHLRYFLEDLTQIGVTATSRGGRLHVYLSFRHYDWVQQIGEWGYRADFCVESLPETAIIIRSITFDRLASDLEGFMRGY